MLTEQTLISKDVILLEGNNINWKSRKLWMSITLLAVSLIFLYLKVGEITSIEWVDFIKWVFTIYVLSNSAEKLIKNKSESNWRSKKLWGFLTLFIISIILVITNMMLFIEWSELVKWIYGFYATSNVLTKVSNNVDVLPKK